MSQFVCCPECGRHLSQSEAKDGIHATAFCEGCSVVYALVPILYVAHLAPVPPAVPMGYTLPEF